MGKKGGIGKFIVLTTTVAAIGGICYIFRDKIKESAAFKSASGKAGDIYDSVKNRINKEEDLFFDDWDDDYDDDLSNDNFDESSREYTTISSTTDDTENTVDSSSTDFDDTYTDDITIPTIDLSSSVNISSSDTTIPEAYENEGLSDTYEDPDVLEEQDKLDF